MLHPFVKFPLSLANIRSICDETAMLYASIEHSCSSHVEVSLEWVAKRRTRRWAIMRTEYSRWLFSNVVFSSSISVLSTLRHFICTHFHSPRLSNHFSSAFPLLCVGLPIRHTLVAFSGSHCSSISSSKNKKNNSNNNDDVYSTEMTETSWNL